MITVHDLRHVDADTVGAWADHIATNMRASDVEEIDALSGMLPREALYSSIEISTHGFCVMGRDGSPVAMFGAAPHPLPNVGVVWMLGTDGIRREAYSIAKATRRYFDTLNEPYPVLWNYIDARNTVSMRWLRWGGFAILRTITVRGNQFHIFARSTHSV